MDPLHWLVCGHAALTCLLFLAWRAERAERRMWERNARYWLDAYDQEAGAFTDHIKDPLWRGRDAA